MSFIYDGEKKPSLTDVINDAEFLKVASKNTKTNSLNISLNDFLASFNFEYVVYKNDNVRENSLRLKLVEDCGLDENLINEPLVGLIDKQGANLGGIESDRFILDSDLVLNVIERMDVYIQDSVMNEFITALENRGIDASEMSLCEMVAKCKELNVGKGEVCYTLAEAVLSPENVFVPELGEKKMEDLSKNTNENILER